MKDSDRNDKGYFTYQELAYRLLLIANGGWTYEKMDQALAQWKEEGKIIEIESGKYKPNPDQQQQPERKELSTSGTD